MTVHETRKTHLTGGGRDNWLVDCSCGFFLTRLVRLEEEADIDIAAHMVAVEQERQRLTRVRQAAGLESQR